VKHAKLYAWLILVLLSAVLFHWTSTGHILRSKIEPTNICILNGMSTADPNGCVRYTKVTVDDLEQHRALLVTLSGALLAGSLSGMALTLKRRSHR